MAADFLRLMFKVGPPKKNLRFFTRPKNGFLFYHFN